jgi:hypothetical protein
VLKVVSVVYGSDECWLSVPGKSELRSAALTVSRILPDVPEVVLYVVMVGDEAIDTGNLMWMDS